MARALRAKKPEDVKPGKPKVLIFGAGGVGKTEWACRFPSVYFMDIEGGATRPQYQKLISEGGGAYLGKMEGSQDFGTVIGELETLATTEHDYRTVVIDSFSQLYLIAATIAEGRVGSDFGRDKKEANKPTRQLMMWLERLDMNVILICHRKPIWKRVGKELTQEGFTFDGWDKMEYLLDLCVEVEMNKAQRFGIVRKTRYETFAKDTTFAWTFKEFAARAGEETMLRKAKPFSVASPETVMEIKRLIGVVKLEQDWIDTVLSKAGVTDLSELDSDRAAKTLEWLKAKINPTP